MSIGNRLWLVVPFAVTVTLSASAANACDVDADCKGGRVCIKNQCISPPAGMPEKPLVGNRCLRDKDCLGEDTCNNGMCTPPGSSASAAAPAPAVAPQSPPPVSAARSCERDGDCSIADVCQERRCVPFAQKGQPAPPSPSPASAAAPAPTAAPSSSSPPRTTSSAPATTTSEKTPSSPDEPFGKRGQLMPSGQIFYQSTSFTLPDGSTPVATTTDSISTLSFSPRLQYFVANQFALGVSFGYTSTTTNQHGGASSTSTSLSIGPVMTVVLPLGDRVSIAPTFSALYHTSGQSVSSSGTSPDVNFTWISLNLEANLLLHVTSHFFIGAGPYLIAEFASKVSVGTADAKDATTRRFLGLSTVIGGYF